MKKWIKILIAMLITPIVLFLVLLISYIIVNSQGVVEPFHVGKVNAEKFILIVSQGSDFKNELVISLIREVDTTKNYISVIDCTTLGDIDERDWDAIVMIHTMQIHNMPEEANLFLSNVFDYSKVILVSTSGAGDDMVEGFDVDAISSPSRIYAIPQITTFVMKKLVEKKIILAIQNN